MSDAIIKRCRLCGLASEGIAFADWVKPTFTDWDKLVPGEIACRSCLFWFDESSAILAARVGKDSPQRMRNYSHFVVNGEWIPLSKGDKAQMRRLLLGAPFPELAAIAESGQKHIVFRAVRNASGGGAGWVQFEEQRVWVESAALAAYLTPIESLYAGFSKAEIETGHYAGHRIAAFGVARWQDLEARVRPWRDNPLFSLAIFLAQRSEDDSAAAGGRPSDDDMAGNSERLQESVSDDAMGTVRERDPQRGLYKQPGEIRQLPLW